jgi:hypothetical protein
MKIVLLSAVCLVLLVVMVVAVGYLLPKSHVATRSAIFRAPPEKLYALISGTQVWRPDVVRFEVVSDSGGREVQHETTRDGKTIAYEVSERVPPIGLKRRIVSQDLPYSGTWTYSLESRDGLTVVRITEQGEVTNPVFRFVSRFILGHTATIDQYLHALGNAVGQNDVSITG